ncbi:WxL domain-containing protein [Streptococcaceae bacterium ESL0729]|nr:WxL domain-containing protein [Streptococcaceae bacterium ESL0729]
MNAKKLLGLGLAGAVLVGSGAATAFAADENHVVTGQTNNSQFNITILDDDTVHPNPDPINPPVPTDPTSPVAPGQTSLTLEHVPTKYEFSQKVSNGTYSIASGTIGSGTPGDGTDAITVFNDRGSRVWNVKAEVRGQALTLGAVNPGTPGTPDADLPVTQFNITTNGANGNGTATNVATTGYNGVVAKSAASPSSANNTGTISTQVTAVSINFTDSKNQLKAGDQVNGTIDYQLYMVTDPS